MNVIRNPFRSKALATLLLFVTCGLHAAPTSDEIPRAPSTPDTPKNWVAPDYKIYAQSLVDELMAAHPEVVSITMHGTPPDGEQGVYTMFAGSFDDRIGNTSSPGDAITIVKAVTQVESKWGSVNWKKKVSIILPLKDETGTYLPAAMVVAFKTSPEDSRVDTDFLAPGVVIRDGLNSRIKSFEALFEPVQ